MAAPWSGPLHAGVAGRRQQAVVVGGGLAGSRACEELRSNGFEGRVRLLCAEAVLPYDRPPLSKAVLADQPAPDTTLRPQGYSDLDVDVELSSPATSLTSANSLRVNGVTADAVVLSTGARAARLTGQSETALVLRTRADAELLRAGLLPSRRVVVVGASWIGAEVATAAARAGCLVTVLEGGPTPVPALGPEAGARIAKWFREAGVDLRLGAGVATTSNRHVQLTDGTAVEADLVVVGVGVRPDTSWLASSGGEPGRQLLGQRGAVQVDACARTALPGVVAVGDCAARWSPRYGQVLANEHWEEALHAPAAAVAALLGNPRTFDPVPSFWSDQFGHTIQDVGVRVGGERAVWRDAGEGSWSVGWLAPDGRLVAFTGVDRPREVLQARKLIAAGAHPEPARLADPDLPVKSTVAPG